MSSVPNAMVLGVLLTRQTTTILKAASDALHVKAITRFSATAATAEGRTTNIRKQLSMKVTVPGRTPMERLSNLTKRIVAVPKHEVEHEDKKWQRERRKSRRKSSST
jgi:hypothetical protein